jgi:hypothetical protein
VQVQVQGQVPGQEGMEGGKKLLCKPTRAWAPLLLKRKEVPFMPRKILLYHDLKKVFYF